MEDDGSLGGKFWLKVFGIVVACGVGAAIVFILLGGAWARFGALGAIILFGALLLGFAWIYDRRQTRPYDDSVA
ncbi:MAG: hypothetical protein E6F97_04220 [Actinobacteria bacterium]|nr:MAG: hypothetical protein E6F97_04220 [Actinomycetota bacterium]